MPLFPVFLSVVFVVRNDAGCIEKILSDAVAAVSAQVVDYELIVVDNAFGDESVAILKQLKAASGADVVFASNKQHVGQSLSYRAACAAFNSLYKFFNGIHRAAAVQGLAEDNGISKVTGPDPHLTFDLSPFAISGRGAGVLRLEFACLHKTAAPRIQVFWWGDQQTGLDAATSVTFTADDGVLLVPLHAFSRWLTLGHVRGLRLDLDHAPACGAMAVRNLALHQKTAISR